MGLRLHFAHLGFTDITLSAIPRSEQWRKEVEKLRHCIASFRGWSSHKSGAIERMGADIAYDSVNSLICLCPSLKGSIVVSYGGVCVIDDRPDVWFDCLMKGIVAYLVLNNKQAKRRKHLPIIHWLVRKGIRVGGTITEMYHII